MINISGDFLRKRKNGDRMVTVARGIRSEQLAYNIPESPLRRIAQDAECVGLTLSEGLSGAVHISSGQLADHVTGGGKPVEFCPRPKGQKHRRHGP